MPGSRDGGRGEKLKCKECTSAWEGFGYHAKEFGLAAVEKSKLLDSIVT